MPQLVDAALAAHPGSSRVLLLVDQWEELYTYPQKLGKDVASFADRLVAATNSAPLTVVLTLRADFTGRAIEHRPLRDRLQEATVLLGGMTRSECELAITGPARVAGLRFEPGLVGRILNDVGDEPGKLPLLEFCLTQLYARRQDGTLCQAAFEAIGGVRGAIVQRADNVIDAMESQHPGRGTMARDIFLQLVQLGEGSEDTRRRAPLGDFDDAARALIGELATARLLVTGRDPGSEQETVEVAHEALIRSWPRLQAWLLEDRADLHQRRDVERATRAWQMSGDAHRWPDERVIGETAPMLRRLGSRFELNDAERDFLGPLTADQMLSLLAEPSTPHALRARVGDRLALLPGGDPRPGVGVGANGLPDIDWAAIPGGEVELEVEATGLWTRWRGRPRFHVAPFHIARHPLTVAQWRVFVDDDAYDQLVGKPYPYQVPPEPQRGSGNQPAVNVSWIEAMAYCQWLSAALGYPVRLPSEWEWQQAATGGDRRHEFPWGEWQEGRANTFESGLSRVIAVGLYPQGASVQGVLDLAGNTWDWCRNKFDTPKDVTPGGDARRVMRGGSWNHNRDFARCACRNHFDPGGRVSRGGLRLVCVSPILKR